MQILINGLYNYAEKIIIVSVRDAVLCTDCVGTNYDFGNQW